jgi:hypothetical protein
MHDAMMIHKIKRKIKSNMGIFLGRYSGQGSHWPKPEGLGAGTRRLR